MHFVVVDPLKQPLASKSDRRPVGTLHGGSTEDSFEFAKGQLLLVQAKRLSLGQTFIESVPEAVSQAITVLKSTKYTGTACSTSSSENFYPSLPEVCFCLSDV
jgi:hypothetical protein